MLVPGKADVLLDVAHNPAGAWALRAALSSLGYAESDTENGCSSSGA
jgi:folylpolyglutamate synthase/dihydropteroate synthase